MNVLVTGASGFIGRQLLEKLDSPLVKALGRDLPTDFPSSRFYQYNIDSMTDYSEALCDVDIVVHLAARVHIMNDDAIEPLEEYREVNTYGTTNLAKQAAMSGVKRFIFVSSIKVNGESTDLGRPFFFMMTSPYLKIFTANPKRKLNQSCLSYQKKRAWKLLSYDRLSYMVPE